MVAWGNYLQWIGLNKTPLSNYEYLPDRSSLDEDDDNARSKASPKKDYLNEKSTIVMSQTEPGELTVFPTLLDEFKTDFMISGVSPMGNDFIFLAYLQDEVCFASFAFFDSHSDRVPTSCPHQNYTSSQGMVNRLAWTLWRSRITTTSRPLIIRMNPELDWRCVTDLPRLCNLVTEGKYYISSPKCVIIATPNDERTAEENKKTLAANFAKLFQNYEGYSHMRISSHFQELLLLTETSRSISWSSWKLKISPLSLR